MQTGPVMRFMNRPGLCYVIALDRDIHVDITKECPLRHLKLVSVENHGTNGATLYGGASAGELADEAKCGTLGGT